MEIFPDGSGLSPSKEVNKGEIIIIIIKVERKRTYGNELRVTLHHCN